MEDLSRFLQRFRSHPPAASEQIASVEADLGVRFPGEYAQFLRICNGGEGFVGQAYAVLWDVSELGALNESYESDKWAPGFLIFGSDGGGEAFGFDTRNPNWPIVQIPFVGMNWNDARPLGETFSQFLGNLFAGSLL
jgi:hypothetical protein